MGLKCFQHQRVAPSGLPLPCLQPVAGLAPERSPEATAHTDPEGQTPPHVLSPDLTPGLVNTCLGRRNLEMEKAPPLGSSLPVTRSRSQQPLTAAPAGALAWLHLWRIDTSVLRGSAIHSAPAYGSFFFPKRKEFGSESSSETEQLVVPVEPGAVSGCSGLAQNLK